MIVIDDIIVSDDLFLVRFCCHLDRCFGACCIAGDAGAPLDADEISLLEDHIDDIAPFMTERGLEVVRSQGVFDYDSFGSYVTPLVRDAECAFCNFTDGIAWCAIEKAYEEGGIRFRKPISCHLYPVRITRYDDFEAVNYHKWPICKPALKNGKKQGLMLYQFLKVALIRKYGKKWYYELERAIMSRLEESD
jgi:hypothetical protein